MNKDTIGKIEKEFEKSAKMTAFLENYRELITAFRSLVRESRINDIVIEGVSLPERWYIKYPNLKRDMDEMGLSEKLLGLKIK